MAVVVPAGYTFEDDVCDSEVGSRGRKQDLGTSEVAEAAGAPKREPTKAKVEEPGTGGVQPVVRKRRGRPKKSERLTTAEDKPRTEVRNDADAAANAEAPLEAGGQPPTARRVPEGNETEGGAAELASPDRGSVRLPISLFCIERGLHSRMEI